MNKAIIVAMPAIMILLIKIEGSETTVQLNGYTTKHKKTFLQKLHFKDFLLYVEDQNKKQNK